MTNDHTRYRFKFQLLRHFVFFRLHFAVNDSAVATSAVDVVHLRHEKRGIKRWSENVIQEYGEKVEKPWTQRRESGQLTIAYGKKLIDVDASNSLPYN